MYFIQKTNMIGFDLDELIKLYENAKTDELFKELNKSAINLNNFQDNKLKQNEIADRIVNNGLKKKEEIEIFIAIDACLAFYKKDSKICFVLRSGVKKDDIKIAKLEDLKNIVEEKTLTDFAIFSDDGLRQFQLKQYKNNLDTDSLFNFIKDKVYGHGHNSDNINFIFLLQGSGGLIQYIDYKKLKEKIESLNFSFSSQILILYNEQNKFNVINQIYPKLATCRKEITDKYLSGEF